MAESKKSRKHGRNKNTSAAYRASQRREFNKARRLMKYLRKHPGQQDAWTALKKLGDVLYASHRSALQIGPFLEAHANG